MQSVLNGILIDKIDVGENFLIETPSFIANYTKLLISTYEMSYLSNSTNEIPFQNKDLFKIPSFCDLTNSIDCMEDKIVLLKVKKIIQF